MEIDRCKAKPDAHDPAAAVVKRVLSEGLLVRTNGGRAALPAQAPRQYQRHNREYVNTSASTMQATQKLWKSSSAGPRGTSQPWLGTDATLPMTAGVRYVT